MATGTLAVLAAPAVLGDKAAPPRPDRAPTVVTAPAPGSPGSPGSSGTSGSPGSPAGPGASPADVPALPAVPPAERPAPVGVASPVAEPSTPVSVTLPAIGVTSGLEHLDLGPDGTLAAPVDFDRAGWFAGGVSPGRPGPAVIAGHVDSRDGPAVFHRLGDLAAGDVVEVERADGSSVRFRVTGVAQYAKDRFPTEDVYGPVAGAELRLITCAGPFDRDSGHYRSNLVVSATLA